MSRAPSGIHKSPKGHSCTIDAKSAFVIFARPFRPRPGLVMLVRDAHYGSAYYRVRVTSVNDDGYFFANRE